MPLSRERAMELLRQYNREEFHICHALSVEAVLRHFAGILGEDPEKWGIVGLLHDIDFEMYPEQHCVKAQEILRQHGAEEEIIRAVASHGYGIVCDIEPLHPMEKALYAVDELTGLIFATALMRPSKSLLDLEVKSVKKKFKSPSFAAGVNRDVIEKGADMLGMDLDTLIGHTIAGMRDVAEEIGLRGEL